MFWKSTVRKCNLWELDSKQWKSLGVYTMHLNYLRMRSVRDEFLICKYVLYTDGLIITVELIVGTETIEGNVKLWTYYKFVSIYSSNGRTDSFKRAVLIRQFHKAYSKIMSNFRNGRILKSVVHMTDSWDICLKAQWLLYVAPF